MININDNIQDYIWDDVIDVLKLSHVNPWFVETMRMAELAYAINDIKKISCGGSKE